MNIEIKRNLQKWMLSYEYAKKYFEEKCDLLVSINYKVEGFNLGQWISKQRHDYKNGTLETDKIQLLNSIEMIWDIFEYQWNIGFNYARQYYKKYGNLAILTDYTIDDFNLGQWISDQRKRHKKGLVSQERIKSLNTINMIWDKNEYNWEVGFLHAEQYYKEFGNLKAHSKYKTLDKYPLGRWIDYQRQNKKRKGRGVITQIQIDRLNKIGMIWDADKTNSITTSFAEQAIFYFISLLFDNAIISYKELGYDIDIYLPDLKLGIEYDGFYFHKDRYEKDYSKNKRCLKDGITLIRIREPKLKVFDNCVCYTRKNYNNKDLEETITWLIEYINKLFNKNLNLDVDIKKYKHTIIKNVGINSSKEWQNGFSFAKKYYKEFGDLNVQVDLVYQGFKLGKWVSYQRAALKGTSGRVLQQYKKDLLDSIGMVWNFEEYRWTKKFNLAKKYYLSHGDLSISCHQKVEDVNLGEWVDRQRKYYKNNALSKEKIESLNSIGMNWDAPRGLTSTQ